MVYPSFTGAMQRLNRPCRAQQCPPAHPPSTNWHLCIDSCAQTWVLILRLVAQGQACLAHPFNPT